MSVRTLRNRERDAAQPESRLGRPPHPASEVAAVAEDVQAVQAVLGHQAGRRTLEEIVAAPRRVLAAALRTAKQSSRAHAARRQRALRVQRIVLAKNVILGQDSTFTGHVNGQGAWSEVTRDWATLEARAFGDGRPVTEAAMLAHLEQQAAEGTLPLVHASDNGTAYVTPAVEAWLEDHEVIHLRNRTHTATDNAPTERAIGEAKAEAGLGAGVPLMTADEGVRELEAACRRLNQRPRPSRGGMTSEELTRDLPTWETRVERSVFFRTCRAAIQHAVQEGMTGRQRRQAERQAVFETLEGFGLLRTTRGEEALRSEYRK